MDAKERSTRLMHLSLLLIFITMLLAVVFLANLLGLWVYFVVFSLLVWVTIGEHSLLDIYHLDLRENKDDLKYHRIVQISDFHLNKMALKPIIKCLDG